MITDAWATQAITAAADLGIADALAKGPLSADELASAVSADADALSRLLRALIARGIFHQRRDGRYDLTPLADTLRSDADVSMAALARFLGSPQHHEHWSHLTDAVRTGRAVVPVLQGKPLFEYLADDPEFAEIFNDAMTSTSELATASLIAAYDFGASATVVDVGGGHGRLLAAILGATPHSRGILFYVPQVVAGAPAVLEGGDAYILKQVIHDWPDDDAVRILGNVRRAAATGRNVLLVEGVLPGHNREFSGNWVDLEMLVSADARERTAAEYGELLRRAGFDMTRVVETASPLSVVEATAI